MSARTKELNSSDLFMQEVIGYGGCKFTRFHLLKELQARGFSAADIDLHVCGPGLVFDLGITNTFNDVPNVVPGWFWTAVEKARGE